MIFREFRDIRKRRDNRRGLPDLLNYAFLEDAHVLIMKDGARLAAFECHGPDLNSASDAELDAHRALANRALLRLDEGFAYQIDFVRFPSAPYPERIFADPVSGMIGHEGALHYQQEGRHYESRTVLAVACQKLSEIQARLGSAFVTGTREREREWFNQQIADFADAMSPVWKLTPLDADALLSYLTSCINGYECRVRAPRGSVPLDMVLGNQQFVTGSEPAIGPRHIRVISLAGLPPHSHAELATFFAEMPLAFRYSIRGLPQGLRASVGQLSVVRRNWFQKRKGPRALLSESFGSGSGSAFDNQHAVKMAADADEAITEAEGGDVRFCYATMKIVLTAPTRNEVREQARVVFKACQNMGFDPRLETHNATEAWLGSLPIHGWYDVRKPLVSTRNLADIMPLTSVWSGLATNPCPYYPPNTPALCYGATTGGTPWRLNLHVADTGHTLIIGPTGSGKSVALGTIVANFRAVPEGQVFFFDKGYSAYVLTHALGGDHLDLGEDAVPLQPLARIDDPTDRMQTLDLIQSWIELQKMPILPRHVKALQRALTLVAEGPVSQRTITNLMTQVQDAEVRDGLSPLSLAGPLGRFLDADEDVTLTHDFMTFELETLMGMGPKVTIPVLTYLFHRIEQRLDGRPTLIVIDEAWLVLANETFGTKLEEWLRTFRKKNAAVVLATQSLSEIANSSNRDVVLESCPTKIYLPNVEGRAPQTRELYRRFGLTDRQIEIVAEAAPKRDYYYTSPLGRRLFQFSLGPAALAFIGAGGKDDVVTARGMMADYRDGWTSAWLMRAGLTDWAKYLEQQARREVAA